jgi:hypothetical protein
LVLAPNGDLITSNGDAVNADPNHPNELVEYTKHGQFVGQFQLDSGAPGAAFGLAVQRVGDQVRFAAVDDDTNTLQVWTFQTTSASQGSCDHKHGSNLASSSVQVSSSGNSTTPSPDDPIIQQIDALFQAFNAEIQSLEAIVLALHPQLSDFFHMLNADLDALEAQITSKL